MTAPICLLTRPEAQSRDLAADLSGVELVISPILRIVGLPADPAKLAAAPGFVFTSANALPFAGAAAGRPALCVGPQTAAAARASGFDVTEGPGDALGLLPLLGGRRADWLYLHGRHRARSLPIASLAVYDQQAQPLSDTARALLADSRPVVLPIFSARSAELLSVAVARARAEITVIAISSAANSGYTGPAARRHIAARPDRSAMLQAILAQYHTERSGLPWVETERGGR